MSGFVRPRERLQRQIDGWWREWVARVGDYCPNVDGHTLAPDIDDFDADSFLRGCAAGLFWVEGGDTMYSSLLPAKPNGSLTPFALFEKVGTGKCQIRQENIPHYAAASELVLDYGWAKQQVTIESPRVHALTQGALDVVVFRDPDRSLAAVAGEAKARRAQLVKMLIGIRACHGEPNPPMHPPYEHKKCLGIMAFRPSLFLGIAAGVRRVFPVAYIDGWFQLGQDEMSLEALRAPGSAAER
jgi:hypothetical protein